MRKYKKEIEESNEKSKNDLANYVTTFIENAKTKLNNVFSIQTIENKITTFMNKVFRDNYDISQEKIVKETLNINDNLETHVEFIKIYPGIDAELIDYHLDKLEQNLSKE